LALHHKRGAKKRRKLISSSIERTVRLISQTKLERGDRSEEFVLRAAELLKEEGLIINCYHTSHIRLLDKKGIDIIFKTKQGFYYIQVKSSPFGAQKHNEAQQFTTIPIYLILRIPGEAKTSDIVARIKEILEEAPSHIDLPYWIRRELILAGIKT
jgi:hypothetical protein